MRLPILRKDFIVDSYQVVESLARGADALRLLVAALAPGVLERITAAGDSRSIGVPGGGLRPP